VKFDWVFEDGSFVENDNCISVGYETHCPERIRQSKIVRRRTLQYSRERRMTCGLPIQLFATENFAKSNTNRNHLAAGKANAADHDVKTQNVGKRAEVFNVCPRDKCYDCSD